MPGRGRTSSLRENARLVHLDPGARQRLNGLDRPAMLANYAPHGLPGAANDLIGVEATDSVLMGVHVGPSRLEIPPRGLTGRLLDACVNVPSAGRASGV